MDLANLSSETPETPLKNLFKHYGNREVFIKTFKFFLFSFLLTAISDIPNYYLSLFFVSRSILFGLLLSTIFLPLRHGILLLLMLSIAGQDIVSSGIITDNTFSTASIWQIRFWRINPSWIFFICLSCLLLKNRKIIFPPLLLRALFWFLTIPVIMGFIYGGFLTKYASIQAVVDLKFAFILVASTILFLSTFQRYKDFLPQVLLATIGAFLARHFFDFIYLLVNAGPSIVEGVSRASADSAKGGVIFLAYIGMMLVWTKKRMFLGALVSILSISLLIAYGTRELWIMFMLGGIVLLLQLGLRRGVLFLSIASILTVCGGWALFVANPDSLLISSYRSKTITEGRSVKNFYVRVPYNVISRIDPVRYGQFLNVFDSMKRRNAFFFGTGYGGYYEDYVAPFSSQLQSAFPVYSFYTRKYYRAHSFPLHIFLKHGIFGLIIISSLWILPSYRLFVFFRNKTLLLSSKNEMFHSILLCIAPFMFTCMFQLYWSGKGLFINGIFISTCLFLVNQNFYNPECQN